MSVFVTITPVDVAQAVADEINLPANTANWSQTGFACSRKWLPAYDDAQLATLQLAVMPILRDRERSQDGGATRAHLKSEHTVKIWMQQLVSSDPATYNGQLDALAAFAGQVDDYFMTKHRKLNQVAGHAVGQDNVYAIRSKITIYGPKDLDERHLWVGVIELTFAERTAW